MASYTPNLNLKKPASSDYALISDINSNMDTIDTEVAKKQAKNLVFSNKTASSWSADSTYSGYGYRCAVACSGVTASDVAEVVFGIAQASSGNYAPLCNTYSGGIYIYSKVNDSITIPTIIVFKG